MSLISVPAVFRPHASLRRELRQALAPTWFDRLLGLRPTDDWAQTLLREALEHALVEACWGRTPSREVCLPPQRDPELALAVACRLPARRRARRALGSQAVEALRVHLQGSVRWVFDGGSVCLQGDCLRVELDDAVYALSMRR